MTSKLYGRRIALIVNDLRFEASGAVDSFHIAFRVDRTVKSSANKAQAEIHNLSEDSRGRVAVKRPQFILEAGYEDTQALIFKGQATQITSEAQNPGYITKIVAQDGLTAQRRTINKTLKGPVKVSDALSELAGALKVGASQALSKALKGDFDGAIKVFTNGLTFSGTASKEMDRLTKSLGLDWSIQDGELLITKQTDTTQDSAIVLRPDTGLIGTPRQDVDSTRPNRQIVRGRSLLQPGLRIARKVQLETNAISGLFKLIKVSHIGNTITGDFFSEFELVEVP